MAETDPTLPGPLTLAMARLGRLLGINVRAAMQGDEIAVLLDTDAVVITKSKTKEGAIANAATFLNKLSLAVERSRGSAPRATAPLKDLPKVTTSTPSVRRIG